MSYVSIRGLLGGRDPADLSSADQHMLMIEAFRLDLPLGMAHLGAVAAAVREGGARKLSIQDPVLPLGGQLIRLLGADRSRHHVERHFGVSFGLYNCCGIVAAPTTESLEMSDEEQILLQSGDEYPESIRKELFEDTVPVTSSHC